MTSDGRLTGVAHTAICVPDVHEAVRWYRDVLELQVLSPPYRLEGAAIERDMGELVPSPVAVEAAILGVGDDDRVLEVIGYPNAPSTSSARADASVVDAGITHVGLTCDDIVATRARLEAAGVTFLTSGIADVAGVRTTWLRDPWGVVFILVEKRDVSRPYWRQFPLAPPTDAPSPPPRQRSTSLLLVNTGDGKGKSTAAFGTALRAVARGWRVAVVQFLKSGEWHAGEEAMGRRLGVEWYAAGDGFTWDSADLDETRAKAVAAWAFASSLIGAGAHELVVLDEVTYPMSWGWISTDDAVAALVQRPSHVNVVATGRDAPAALVDAADTVTEMRKVKHAYDAGVRARRGLDY